MECVLFENILEYCVKSCEEITGNNNRHDRSQFVCLLFIESDTME